MVEIKATGEKRSEERCRERERERERETVGISVKLKGTKGEAKERKRGETREGGNISRLKASSSDLRARMWRRYDN